jgi:putative alpha-1,2-mannosidase
LARDNHIAHLYVCAGVPYKTQVRVRSLMETMYAPERDGIQGNEDVGQMSAWFVMSALGFYPVDPVSGNYILGSPLFDRAVVALSNDRQIEIDVRRSDPNHAYIHSFSLNGKPQSRVWFHHGEISHGGTLSFQMGPEPDTSFGAASAVAPPSLTL